MWFYIMIVSLLIALVWLTRVREGFVGGTTLPGGLEVPNVDLKDLPDPHMLFKQARELLDKYDKPDVWQHAALVMDKDPGQLARMQLGINN
jgi:hypothetical protein